MRAGETSLGRESSSGHTPSWLGGSDPGAACNRVKFKQKEDEEEEEEQENPLLVPLEEKSVLEERQTSLWFGKVSPAGLTTAASAQQLPCVLLPAASHPQDAFAGIEDDADEELELGQSQMLAEKQHESQKG